MQSSTKRSNPLGATPKLQRFNTQIALGVSSILLCACVGPTPKFAPVAPPTTQESGFHKGTLRPYNIRGKTYRPFIPEKGYTETGLASWYGYESPNSITADGEHFNTDDITAAHKTLPLPSLVEVTNLDNGKKLTVRLNDRGPFSDGRIIDLSRGSAKALGIYSTGTARVKIKWLGPAPRTSTASSSAKATVGPASSGQFIVQLGAFGVKENAKSAQNRLDNAQIMKKDNLYIVYLGPFKSANLAESARQHALSVGFSSALIRTK